VRVTFVRLCMGQISGPEFRPREVVHLDALPLLFPIPSFDCHIITPGQDDVCGRMYGETPYVVRMRLENYDLLMCIVIEDA
jgi:hypothetical protein